MLADLGSLRLGFAFGLGTATFFAPCAFPMLPGYVAFYLGDDDESPGFAGTLRRATAVGVLTSLGFFVVYAVLAGVVMAVGTRILGNVSLLELVVGALLIGLGAAMLTGRFSPDRLHVQFPERRRSPTGFFLFGVVYAAAAAGCTAPLFVAIAGVGLSAGPVAAVATFAAYAAGMSVLMIAVTLLSALGRDALLRRLSASTGRVTRLAGAVLIVAGVVQIYFFLFRFDGLAMLGL